VLSRASLWLTTAEHEFHPVIRALHCQHAHIIEVVLNIIYTVVIPTLTAIHSSICGVLPELEKVHMHIPRLLQRGHLADPNGLYCRTAYYWPAYASLKTKCHGHDDLRRSKKIVLGPCVRLSALKKLKKLVVEHVLRHERNEWYATTDL